MTIRGHMRTLRRLQSCVCSTMDASAVTASLSELSEELAFPAAVRDVVVKSSTGDKLTLGALLTARPRAMLVLGRNLL